MQVREGELTALASAVNDRNSAVRQGLVIEGQRFEVSYRPRANVHRARPITNGCGVQSASYLC